MPPAEATESTHPRKKIRCIKLCKILNQCFGQNSGRPVSDGAIVTKVLVIGAGFFQAMPLG